MGIDVPHRRPLARLAARCALEADTVRDWHTGPYAPPVTVAGDGDQLDQLLINLVANAAEAARETAGGVRVRWSSEGDRAIVVVEDDGPGIPEAQRDQLFTRGKRLDTTGKPGTGLVLAIVRDVAEIYGGRITLEESEDLGGLLARLSLPLG